MMKKVEITTGEDALKAFGGIETEFVREAADAEMKTERAPIRRTVWRVAAAAAALALIVGAALMITKPGKNSGHTALNPTQAPETAVPDVRETTAPDETAAQYRTGKVYL